MSDLLLAAAVLVSTLLVTPPAVRFVDGLLFRHEAYWTPSPRPSARRPFWNWLTPDGFAWALVVLIAVIPILLAFGL